MRSFQLLCRDGIILSLLLSATMLATFASTSASLAAVTCGQHGPSVDTQDRCSAFRQFTDEDTPPDPRVAKNLHLGPGEYARSIALVVGISKYDNPDYNLPAAEIDVAKLTEFLVNDQKFDEVIVLQNETATIENIRYFLRTYSSERAAYYDSRVRFLFAFSGHGVPVQFVGKVTAADGAHPSVGLALMHAENDRDLQNIYGLNELRALLGDLGKNVFQSLALINACYGGYVFGFGLGGGDPNDPQSRSSYGITAGPADETVISVGAGNGSAFFDKIIEGVETGEGDIEARNVTLGLTAQPSQYNGIVRLGALDSYISWQMANLTESGVVSAEDGSGNGHHWSGSIAPEGMRSLGGFFFLQHRPPDTAASNPPITAHSPLFNSTLHIGTLFSPSLNQIAAVSSHDDGFGTLRGGSVQKRGVDVSRRTGPIDWKRVSQADIRFAYIKSTQGLLQDASFPSNWNGAKEVGLPRGAYHFLSFCESPDKQLANIRQTVPIDAAALPIAVDAELYEGQSASTIGFLREEGICADHLGMPGVRQNLRSILDGLQSTYGRMPILYGNDYLLDKVLGADFTSHFPLWRVRIGVRRAPQPPWTLWQYGTNETVDGIKGPVDVNILGSNTEGR